jgi:TolB-like protein/tetratricopeptide (TPR) repeat protein
MAKLFVSYARDDEAAAAKVVHALERAGHEVWWDAKIEGGTRYSRLISEALDGADAVVVLWSQRSVESDWVRDEAAHGRERHRLVPLSLDGTRAPLGFRQFQNIDMSRWHGRVDAPQFRAVERAIAVALGQEAVAPVPPRKEWMTRRQVMAAGTAAAVAGGGALFAWRTGLIGAGKVQARSIAVLPFKNLSGDPNQAYLSDGLTEEIRSALARNAGLMVLAATSSNSVGDMAGGAKAIASKLGVAYLLEGSVQRAGDTVGVATNLTSGSTGFSEWSQSVERPLGDIFAFENEIARTVSNAMSVRMATKTPPPGGTRNVKAYEAYLRGRALYNLAKGEETDRQARANYELAIAADPNFALAHAALSRVLSSIAASEASASELKSLYAGAIAEARRVIELAPTLAEGHLALGYALFTGELDVRGARPSYDAADRYGRGDADIVLLYALYAVRARRFAQARSAIERALALDPLNPRTWRAAGSIDLASGRPREALGRYDRALALNPSISNAHALKGYALIQMKRWAEAKAALEKEPSAMFRLTGLAILGQKTSDKALAQKSYAQLVADLGDAALYQQAQVLAEWGRSGEALHRLERARAVGDSGLTALATDPFMAPLAKEPRYRALVRTIGFA